MVKLKIQIMAESVDVPSDGVAPSQLFITVNFYTSALSYQRWGTLMHPVLYFQEMFSPLQTLLGVCQCVGLSEWVYLYQRVTFRCAGLIWGPWADCWRENHSWEWESSSWSDKKPAADVKMAQLGQP